MVSPGSSSVVASWWYAEGLDSFRGRASPPCVAPTRSPQCGGPIDLPVLHMDVLQLHVHELAGKEHCRKQSHWSKHSFLDAACIEQAHHQLRMRVRTTQFPHANALESLQGTPDDTDVARLERSWSAFLKKHFGYQHCSSVYRSRSELQRQAEKVSHGRNARHVA